MIIQVRGISGSGKTWVVKQILDAAGLSPVYVSGRRNPLYYRSDRLAVIGSYESYRGGCDNITNGYDFLQSVVKSARAACSTVLIEGLLLSDDVVQTTRYKQLDDDLWVIFLATELETCVKQAETRRETEGKGAGKVDLTRAENRWKRLKRARVRLEAAGIYCRSASAPQAVRLIQRWIV